MDVAARRESKRPAPYAPRRPRRSSRLGAAHDPVDLDDDDKSASGGLFARLFSFFPLGAKKPTTVEEDEPAVDDADELDKHDELETSQESLESALDAAKAVDEPVQNGHAASPAKSPVKSPARSPPSKRSSPARRADKRQSSPVLATSVFGNGTDMRKSLSIEPSGADKGQNVFPRLTGRRRNKPASPNVPESPLAVIKKKKPITFEEYERLSTQLRSLVEPTPQNALALTRTALSTALEGRASNDQANTQDGGRDRRELSVAALPSIKCARPSEDHLPIALPREDRLVRKPKPSRLLTGSKRDTASRSAYSAAVAEKILSTLNKIQAPLDKEAQKPTPSTSLSWAKHHLALTSHGGGKQVSDGPMDADDDIPPTSTIPKVVWKSPEESSNVVVPSTTSSLFSFPKPQDSAPNGTVGTSSVLPPPKAVDLEKTSHSTQAQVTTAPALKTKEQVGQFSFTLPTPAESLPKPAEADTVLFFFTPPPALREPPKRSSGQKAAVGAATSSTSPFSFMPASPKVRPESLTKSVPSKTKSSPVSAATASEATVSSTNPLARFLQTDAGSWRCPTCAVMNGSQHSKCPCCETAQPASAAATSKKPSVDSSASGDASGSKSVNPLARFLQLEPGSWKCPGCAVTNGSKYSKCPCCEAEKPADGSSSEGTSKASSLEPSTSAAGFSFGGSSSAKSTSSASSSFKFGVDAKPSFGDVSTGFSFKPSSQTTNAPPSQPTGGFTFGVSAASDDSKTERPKPTGFSFGVPTAEPTESNKRKPEDDGIDEPNDKKRSTASSTVSKPASGFSFGVGASTGTFGSSQLGAGFGTVATEEKAKPSTISFGSTPSMEEAPNKTSFSFGVKDSATPQKATIPSFLSPGSSSKLPVSKDEKDAPVAIGLKSTAPSFNSSVTTSAAASGSSGDKASESKAAFTFGSAVPGSMPLSSTALNSTPSSLSSTTSVSSDAKPAFSFGGGFSNATPASSKPFTFGSGTTEPKAAAPVSSKSSASASFGQSQVTEPKADSASKPPVFEFGGKAPISSGASTSSNGNLTTTSNVPSFSFGSSSSDTNSKKPETVGFSFGTTPTDLSLKKSDAPAFTFGAAPQAGSSFGSTTAQSFGTEIPAGSVGQTSPFGSSTSSSSGFGTSSAGFGSSQSLSTSFSTTSAGFGSTAVPSSGGFGSTSQSAFGSSTSTGFTPTTSIGFGAPTSTGFGSSVSSGFGATTSVGFGAASTSFGLTPTSTAFGSTPVSTPSFGTTPAPTSSAPAFSFGTSTTTSQPAFGFGATSATSAFSTPSTDVFGSASQATGFGSASSGGFGSTVSTPAFGTPPAQQFGAAAPTSSGFGAPTVNSSFGGSAFGSGAPAAGGFGAPTPTPSPAFGSSFGTPNASFGASGGAFGATPSPASSAFGAAPSPAFGAPATPSFGAPLTPAFGGAAPAAGFGSGGAPGDGFSMGAAPPKGRRILKAKSRTKR